NPAFDASTFEIWAPLLNGGRVVIIDSDSFTDSRRLSEAIDRHSITAMFLTTVLFNQFVSSIGPSLAKLKYLLCGGEQENLESFNKLLGYGGPQHLIHCYGPTETTTFATTYEIARIEEHQSRLPIGRPISNTKVYVLDELHHPVPLGVVGELYIGGAGVANGYLNRPDLTEERFLPDPFSGHADARMYRTGDLVSYLPDGNLIFISRNDQQVKIRGFRIELGEIEARLLEHVAVREAAALVMGEGDSKRLIAYVVAEPTEGLAHTLREHISSRLPEYMIPSAFVRLDELPLTPNGKLDRRALPEPDIDSFVNQGYEAPQGEIESTLAKIWVGLLKVERVGRNDNFFMLGGHSLLAVQMIERLRRIGMEISVRTLFDTPTLSALAQSLNMSQVTAEAPENLITHDTAKITPELLPLIDLTQDDIDLIVGQVEGGVSNIQDIYALSPLQDGILFHHTMATKGDPYLITAQLSFDSKNTLDRYIVAVQNVVDRHDILRTAIMWENLTTPAQVVLRQVALSTTELSLDSVNGSISGQMMKLTDPREHRVDLTKAPLTRFMIAQDIDDKWIVVVLFHHIIGDSSTMQVMMNEIQAFMSDQAHTLLEPQPFRNLISHIRSGPSVEVHEQFFTKMLAEIDTPALPFGLSSAHQDSLDITESHLMLSRELNNKLRGHARRMGVGLASLCHLAWAQVVSRTSGQERVVFGTVLFGRMQGGSGSDQAMGLFINTLPLRIDVGERSVDESVRQVQADLAALLEHEHTSLALAQRCSGVAPGVPLFSTILNCRNHNGQSDATYDIAGVTTIGTQQLTNYPISMSVDDFGTDLSLSSQAVYPIDALRLCEYMQESLKSLVDALEHSPSMKVRDIEIIPSVEREMLLQTWNTTDTAYPNHQFIHKLFENQAKESPDAIAVAYDDQSLTYRELNTRANRRAIHLRDRGIKPGCFVVTMLERSFELIITQIATLKA
ncbi:hypothetical protein BGX26_005861, partial [Mortierella sp. AD094]